MGGEAKRNREKERESGEEETTRAFRETGRASSSLSTGFSGISRRNCAPPDKGGQVTYRWRDSDVRVATATRDTHAELSGPISRHSAEGQVSTDT